MKYLSFNEYCKSRFGCKVYKLSLDGGFTCPNRDGTAGIGGCTFCAGGSGGRFSVKGDDVTEQIKKAKLFVEKKGAQKYIAYFQAYSSTYAPCDKLRELYYEAIKHEDIVALSIATRPDCLPDDVLDLLGEINAIKPVFVELGLQTANEKTASLFNRCYGNSVYENAVKELKKRNINVVTHLIFGLPYETKEDMLGSVKYIIDCETDGVKFHMLNVLKGTELEKDYEQGKFSLMSREEYADLIVEAIALLPERIVVHRLTGDGDKRLLIAPEWASNKKRTLNLINQKINSYCK